MNSLSHDPPGTAVPAWLQFLWRNPFNLALCLFLLTALVGVLTAYDPPAAFLRFGLLCVAVLSFYFLAHQRTPVLWLCAQIISAGAVLVALYFLFTHDWQSSPEKIGLISRLGRLWMLIRPTLPAPSIYPNFAAGITAPVAPFLCALCLRSLRLGSRRDFLLWTAGLLIVLACIGLSSTRGVWISCLAAVGLLILWWGCLRLQQRFSWPAERILLLLFLGAMFLFVGFFLADPEALAGLLDRLPGPKMAGSRLGLQASTVRLIADFPLTGAGLGSFPGLYAHYIEVNPNFILPHGHHLFLDAGLDQGILGMAALVWIFGVPFWLLFRGYRKVEEKSLWAAVLAGLTIFVVQGQAADDFYYTGMAFSLLVLPGFSAALTRRYWKARKPVDGRAVFGRRIVFLAGGLCLLLALFVYRNSFLATLYANLGAVKMVITEMANWGNGRWQEPAEAFRLTPSEPLFQQALQYDPGNRTAHHRLGLIALLQGDFDRANEHLLAALETDPGHPGIRKNLGYSLAWSGRLDQAAYYLKPLPEAAGELSVYQWWWRERGRPDLALRAEELLRLLSG